MITNSFDLQWNGPDYTARLRRELLRAVKQSALIVRRNARDLLNVSGKAQTAKAGLNSTRGKAFAGLTPTQKNNLIFQNGLKVIKDLKTVKGRKANKTLIFGGTYHVTNTTRLTRVYWYGDPLNRWVQSSMPGTPPHKQHGDLQKSIQCEFNDAMLYAKIGPAHGFKYGRIHELGGKALINLPPRPYLAPAFQMSQPDIFAQFQSAMIRAL